MNRCLAAFLAASSIALLVASGCSSPLGGSTCPEGKGTGTCFQVQSPGPMQTCSYNSGNAASCSAGQSSGHCPSANLVGCCVTTASELGCTETGAACYYGATSAAQAKSACTGGTAGTTLSWQTTPP